MRIGVTVSAATGHLFAMTALARRLASRGHEVICIGAPDAAKGAATAGLPFEEICDSTLPEGWFAETSSKLAKLSGKQGTAYTLNWIAETFRAEIADTPRLLHRVKFDGLVVDLINGGVGAVANAEGVPFVTVSCTPLSDLTGVTPMYLFPWPHKDTFVARARNKLGVIGYLRAISGIRAIVFEYLLSRGVEVDPTDPYAAFSQLAYITQIPAAFDFPGDHFPSHFHRTGPFHDGLGRAPVDFPWEQLTGEPLIYASMGTLQNGLAEVFRIILKAVERPGHQLVLSVGPSIAPEILQTSLPNTIIVQRAPQIELLKLATLCVTHAGLNTTLEALTQGVPLAAIPITNDQPGVAARILASGTGLFVPLAKLSEKKLRTLVDKVLTDPSYRACAKAMQTEIEKANGLDMAADLIERAFGGKPRQALELAPTSARIQGAPFMTVASS